jgi:hypothetical protein
VDFLTIQEKASMKYFISIFMLLVMLGGKASFAQDTDTTAQESTTSAEPTIEEKIGEVKGQVDGLNESFLEVKSVVDALSKIKVSGYMQAQFQSAQNDAVKSFAGGNLPTLTHNRFAIRRGRIKFNYNTTFTNYVLQFDASEGGFSTKDAYITVQEPWLKTAELWAGIFNRPFGFEIEYSSSSRETPERTRMFQTLFPGERDLGAKLEIRPQVDFLNLFNLKLGLFNGNGIAAETDNNKDFIGRFGISLPFVEENLAIDAGVSAYIGKVTLDPSSSSSSTSLAKDSSWIKTSSGLDSVKAYSYALKTTTTTTVNKIYTLDNPNATPTAKAASEQKADRQYLGGDMQIYYDLPILGGFSLRGEYISGKQPGSKSDNKFYARGAGDIYLRNFAGYYINYVQNIGNDNQFVLKYDVFDPNTDVKGDDIGRIGGNTKLGWADIKYTTLGLGWIYHWDSNVKFVLYYDMVTNEKINSAATSSTVVNGSSDLTYKNDIHDNVLTFRVQYRF